jgi:hypothetical protein
LYLTCPEKCLFVFSYLPAHSCVLLSCKEAGNETYIRASIEGADKSINLLTIEKIPQSNELGLFFGIFPDGSVIGFRLYKQPAYDTGSYHFRQAGASPDVLTSFSLQIIDFKPALKWSTAQETNLQTFIPDVLHGLNRQGIGSLPGTSPQNYYLPDNAANALINYYYRLKMVDVDGSFRYSPAILYNGAGDYTVGTDKLKGYNGTLQYST